MLYNLAKMYNMNKTYISATELKNNVADILNDVYFNGKIAIIERYGKPIAEIVPARNKTFGREEIKKVLDETFGSIPDFPSVVKLRNFKKRNIKL